MKVGVERCIRRGGMLTEVTEARHNAGDGTHGRVTTARMANTFAANTVFLPREGQGDKGDRVETAQGADGGVHGGVAGPQTDIVDAEEVIASARGAGVLARAEEKVEGEGGTVGRGAESGTRIGVGKRDYRAENREGQRLDPRRGGVGLAPSPKQGREAVVQHAERC